jgi:hypothetical protein
MMTYGQWSIVPSLKTSALDTNWWSASHVYQVTDGQTA